MISNQIGRFLAKFWRVKLGKGCHFKGRPIFRTIPGSNIQIGNNCIFNSSDGSNLIGVYTPCVISTLKPGASITVGDNCGMSGTVIWCASSITIGNNVRCGANTLIYDNDGHSDDPRSGEDKPVVIEDNVWLGYGVKVLKGVTIGKGSLIGACSVVTKDIPAGVVAVGTPCRVIRKI
ncbi:MAG: acyltransferase [Muribaculum sp.]|nr:acyltransferase [Muribaculum sp.]